MSLSLYDTGVGSYLRTINALQTVMGKAEETAASGTLDLEQTVEFRFRWLVAGAAAATGAGGGLAFVVHDDPRRTLARGCGGAGLGVAPYAKPRAR